MNIKTKYNVGDTVWYQKLDRESGIYLPEEKNIEEELWGYFDVTVKEIDLEEPKIILKTLCVE